MTTEGEMTEEPERDEAVADATVADVVATEAAVTHHAAAEGLVTGGATTDRPVADGAEAAVTGGAGTADRPGVRPRLVLVALGLLAAIVLLELAAGPALRGAHGSRHDADVLAIRGVAGMIRDAQVDPTEVSQVAASQHQPAPLALPAQALVDGLLLVVALAVGLPRLLPRRDVTRRARLGVFLAGLAILLAAMVAAVAAIARLRYLVALYLSPPFGTLSYLLLYGSFQRGGSLLVLTGEMALKLVACAVIFRAFPSAASERGMAGLALTSVAATVVTTFCYALAPASLASITDALAAAVVAAAAILWAGVLVSASVRRLV